MKNLFFINFKTLRAVNCTDSFIRIKGMNNPHSTNRGSMFSPVAKGIINTNQLTAIFCGIVVVD
jgi:hypothetical protein